ncbi:MAG: pyridoxal phosphate-dependent decarboxylase family protein [Micrococcales bacterium]
MHKVNDDSVQLREAIFAYTRSRMEYDPPPLDNSASRDFLEKSAGQTVTEDGIGGLNALQIFEDVLAPSTISTDHPNYLSFIPSAPTQAAKLFDLVVSASAIYGGSWLEGAGAVFAENEVLRWLAAEIGLPDSSGGVFVQGGTIGNLSALVAARHNAIHKLEKVNKPKPARWKFVCSNEAHSSLKAAAAVMDVDIIKAPVDATGHLCGAAVEAALEGNLDSVFAIVGTAGTTNFGIVDKLDEIGQIARKYEIWFHVDGAYGLAGILSAESKTRFKGVELADSFIVDPHKWLFAPFDACALVYRDPALARAAHTQHGEYLEVLNDTEEWNPSDYAFNLTRRTRGLPLWFSLATHGIRKYREAVGHNILLARQIADEINRRKDLALVREPELSVVVFTKAGWQLNDYLDWSEKLLARGQAFVVPSSHLGEPNARFAIVNPETKFDDLVSILDSMN